MFKLATDKGKRHKLDSEWSRGILVGMSGRTTEMIVATSEGVQMQNRKASARRT